MPASIVADIDAASAETVAREIGGTDTAISVVADVTDEAQIVAAFQAAVLAFGGVDLVVNNAGLSISKPLLETTVRDWDLQHDVMARGSFLVSRESARILIEQGMGGDLVYIVSKNALFAGPNNVAYGSAKADQAHQVRLLAAELGQFGIRVNGVNPDGVVRGSGIFAKGWGADRAQDLRDPRGQARRVLRPADAAQARGPPGARGGRGLRPDRRRPEPDDGAAHPGRRRGRGGLPAVTAGLVAAVDLGASSGRVMVGRVGPDDLELTEVHRFPNDPVRLPDGLHWDILRLYHEVLAGLREIARAGDSPVSIGVDSWGVDYGLLDEEGRLLGEPYHYRDDRTTAAVDAVHEVVSRAELYARTGLQFLPFNTIYQLAAARGTAGVRGRADDAAHPRPARLLAVRRPRHGGHERLDDRRCSTSIGGPGTPT